MVKGDPGCFAVSGDYRVSHVYNPTCDYEPVKCEIQMEAMVLAAGRGERLRPLTDTVPKPLIEVGGKTIIEHHLHNLSVQGFNHVVINVSHLAEIIMNYLGDGSRYGLRISYSREPEGALETAGGIINALPHFSEDSFLVVNGDVLTNFNFCSLQLEVGSLAGIVLVPNPEHNPKGDFCLDNGWVQHRSGPERESYTFAGVGWYQKELFAGISPGSRKLASVLDEAIGKKQVQGVLHESMWIDVGTMERLVKANFLYNKQ